MLPLEKYQKDNCLRINEKAIRNDFHIVNTNFNHVAKADANIKTEIEGIIFRRKMKYKLLLKLIEH